MRAGRLTRPARAARSVAGGPAIPLFNRIRPA